MEFFQSASNLRPFIDDNPGKASGTYTAPADFNATLTRGVSQSYLEYTLTFLDSGEVYIFREKDPTDPCWGITSGQSSIIPLSERTSLTYMSQGLDGEKYFYDSNGQVTLVVTADPQSYFIRYSYVTTGSTVGCLKRIEVYDGSPDDSTTKKFAEAEYTYVDYFDSFHGAHPMGSTGDLAQVRISKLMSDGVSWDRQYTQYRNCWYHTYGCYQLTDVYENDAIERIMQADPSITTPEALMSRAGFENYASRQFKYFNRHGITPPASPWGGNIDRYGGKYRPIVYDTNTGGHGIGFVVEETVNAGCASCGGGVNAGIRYLYQYAYCNDPPADNQGDPNVVVYLSLVDTFNTGETGLHRTIYGLNWHGVELRKAVIENPNAATLNVVCTSKILDAHGRIIETRPSEAHALVKTDAQLKLFLNPYSNGSWANDTATLEAAKGVIDVAEYDPVTRKQNGHKIKIGGNGPAQYVSATDYNAQGFVVAQHIYPTPSTDRNAADRVTSTVAYTYWDENHKRAIKTQTVTYPAVPVSQNGTGVAGGTQEYYDIFGCLRWKKDALGVVTYYGIDPVDCQRTLTVRDVDTSSLPAVVGSDADNRSAWVGTVPFSRGNGLAVAINQVSSVRYDKLGRIFETTSPDSVKSYTVYAPMKTFRFSAWDDAAQKPILPISVVEVNGGGKPVQSYELPPSAAVAAGGIPTGIDANAAKNTWTRYTYHSVSGTLQHVDRYHVVPASGVGALGTNYYRTTNYHDPFGQVAGTARFVGNGKWQVQRQKKDFRNRTVESLQGVTATLPADFNALNSATYLKAVSKTVFDGDHVAKTSAFFDTGANDRTGTTYRYDSRDRVRSTPGYAVTNGSETPYGPYSVNDYDWRGNVVAAAQFETEPGWNNLAANESYAEQTTNGRKSLSKSLFDIFGKVYRTETFEVSSSGVAGDSAVINHYRDVLGREIAVQQIGHPRSEAEYDAVGRQIRTKVKGGKGVVAMTETEFDAAGHMIAQHQYDLNAGEANGITDGSNNYTRRTSYFWYDKAGRMTTQADYGSGGATWEHFAKPQRPENPPESSSDNCLVTRTAYNTNTGRAEISTDAAGKDQKTVADALGRTVNQFQNYKTGSSVNADEDIETRFTYDGLNNIMTLTAVNPTTGNQVTKYLYEDAYNASLQTSAIYPDSSDTTSSGNDQVKTTYFLDGNVKQITDQNGSVRLYAYDPQRRLATDAVVTLGTNVDGTVRKIGRSYTWNGAVANIASYDASNAVLNEIKYEYDDNGKLLRLYQSHDAAVNVNTTSYVAYTYSGIADGNKPVSVVYPSGKTLAYGYNDLDQLTTIAEGNTTLVSYLYSGNENVMQTTYDEPGLSLTYAGGGLDRFGRVINHGWMKGDEAVVHIQHGYDYAGNRTSRYDSVHAANSELYSYDQVNQIKSLNRGALNQDRTAVTATNFTETWNFDKTGNWARYDKNGTVENRTHNKANEIEGICTHDKNGNMVLMPGLKGKYDAWNRLVEVRDSSDNLLGRYEYNGLNQRIKKTVGATVTKSVFNEKWQELESVTGGSLTSYVWGLRYIDDLVLRQKGDEKLYSLADPNWNVVAVADVSGSVVERMRYDAFGKTTWMDAQFATRNASEFAWNRMFTGQVLDLETGLFLMRLRYHNVVLGRFVSKDPIIYGALSYNYFAFVSNRPTIKVDTFGLLASDSNNSEGCDKLRQKYSKNGLWNGPYGVTTCYCGKAITCTFPEQFSAGNNPWNDFKSKKAKELFFECTVEHENEHVDDFDCSGDATFDNPANPPKFHALVTQASTECKAYEKSLKCLKKKIEAGSCGDDIKCKGELNNLAAREKSQLIKNCGIYWTEQYPGVNQDNLKTILETLYPDAGPIPIIYLPKL